RTYPSRSRKSRQALRSAGPQSPGSPDGAAPPAPAAGISALTPDPCGALTEHHRPRGGEPRRRAEDLAEVVDVGRALAARVRVVPQPRRTVTAVGPAGVIDDRVERHAVQLAALPEGRDALAGDVAQPGGAVGPLAPGLGHDH